MHKAPCRARTPNASGEAAQHVDPATVPPICNGRRWCRGPLDRHVAGSRNRLLGAVACVTRRPGTGSRLATARTAQHRLLLPSLAIMVRLEGVGLFYGQKGAPDILRDLSFSIPAGGFRWLLGASGAGKTSLLRLLTLAVRPTSGSLDVLGAAVARARRRDLPALRRQIGVVYQDFRLLPHLSAFDNVALPLRLAGRPEGQVRADVDEMLRWVTLTRRAAAKPAELSGGEQQRVAIARAVIGRPALLVADEPTGNLDDGQAERLMQLFGELNRLGTTAIVATHNEALQELNRLGTTVVVATHSMALVQRYPARALVLEDGMLVQDGPPQAGKLPHAV
jgi:cell division transport system ATP-binding protein